MTIMMIKMMMMTMITTWSVGCVFLLSARQSLPDLAGVLSSGTKEGTESDDTLGIACQTAHSLILKEPDLGKRLLTRPLVASLNDLSRNKYGCWA